MSMVVQHNITAMNANRMLGTTTSAQAKSTEKLSSGYRINRAADDAAGLSISEKMRKQIKGLTKASTNAQDGISAVQTAEGALTEVHSMLQRMNELATQAANGTNSDTDRKAIQDEIDQLTTEIDRVAETTKFNEAYLLKGDAEGNTMDITLKGHDAGIKGTFTDKDTTATMVMDLSVGKSVSIGGADYTIADATNEEKGEISADDAETKITAELKAANNIGATKTEATVTSKKNAEVPATNANFTTNPDAKAVLKTGDYVILDAANKVVKTVAASATGDERDVTAYTDSSQYKIYKKNAAGTTVDSAKANVKEIAIAHNESSQVGFNHYDVGALTGTTDGAGIGLKDTGAMADGYTVYEATDLADAATLTGVSTNAKVSSDSEKFEVVFTNIMAENDADKAKLLSQGQNLLADAISDKKITLTYNDAGDGTGVFSHDDFSTVANAKYADLDVSELGVVSYKGVKVADIKSTATTSTAGEHLTLGNATSDLHITKSEYVENEAKPAGTEYTFTINKGTAEVSQDLNFSLHVGADADMTNKINVSISAMDSSRLGIKGINIQDETGASATYAIDAIADAIQTVSAQRSALGAVQNRLEHTIANLDNVVENTTSAESSIRDTDMASEMVTYSKNNILAQAGQSMLAQANQANQGVLSLLG